MRFVVPLLCVLLVSGCAKGIDRSLITGEGVDKYRSSFQQAAEAMTDAEMEAYNWAVSDFDIDRLHQVYPNASPRQIIRGEVQKGLTEWSALLQELEESRSHYDAIIAELRKIEPREIRFELDRNFHGLQPRVHAKIANLSQLGVSSLMWRASLFLDGGDTPTAVYDVFDNYNNAGVGRSFLDSQPTSVPAGGMRPGYEYSRTFTIGFVTGDPNWITLAVQNATQRTVTLEPLLDSIKDFSDRAYLDGAPYERIRALEAAIASAKKYEHL
jgi:hypothetical protein